MKRILTLLAVAAVFFSCGRRSSAPAEDQETPGHDASGFVLLTRRAADSLKVVSDELMAKGYRIKIYDAYRPQCAVDYFGTASHPDVLPGQPVGAWKPLNGSQYANRMILREAMLAHGFKPYDCEWWHFTLADEPYPDNIF